MKLVEYFSKLLIRLIAHSTWIRRLATSLVFLTSAEVIDFSFEHLVGLQGYTNEGVVLL